VRSISRSIDSVLRLRLDSNRASAYCRGMKMTNDCYVIFLHFKNGSERYYRDGDSWWKVSTRGRKFRATAEQVLNHLLPALAGLKENIAVHVEYCDRQ
jgi:hypothetical protein